MSTRTKAFNRALAMMAGMILTPSAMAGVAVGDLLKLTTISVEQRGPVEPDRG